MALITIKATSSFVGPNGIVLPNATVEVSDALARDLIGRGKAIAVAAPVTLEDGEEIADLDECSDDELRDIAKEYKIKGATRLDRAALLEAIRAHEAAAVANAGGAAD